MNLSDIYNILKDFNGTVQSWRTILDNIDDAVQNYNKAMADLSEEDPAAYIRELLPQYWQAVRAINIRQWEGVEQLPSNSQYDVGIFLVGFSSLPIVLSIAEIQPHQEIYFIHSNDTRRKCDEITNRFTEMLADPPHPFSPLIDPSDTKSLIKRVQSADRREIAKPSDPVSTFQEIKNIIDSIREHLGNDVRIALDLTGGKKTMIGGGFTAGSIYSVSPQCDMFYVDSSVYNPDRGAPKPGTEFLSQLENPYDVYNVQTVAQAKELFEKHNYEAAAKLWERIDEKLQTSAERYGLDNEHQEIEKNLYMANCYGLWDAIDYVEAEESKSADGNLWDYDTKHTHSSDHSIIDVLEILGQVPRQVSSQVDAVTTHGEISSDEVRIIHHRTLFADEVRIIHYAIDRYQNGIRRMDSDRSDDAIVRFAQVIEILCLYQIYRIANNDFLCLNSSNVSPDDCLAERWGISGLIILLFREGRYRKSRDVYYYIHGMQLNIGEYDGYTDAPEITDIIGTRHDFVHVRNTPGWRVMEENAENLKDLARKFLENFSGDYCSNNRLSFDDLLGLHEFQEL